MRGGAAAVEIQHGARGDAHRAVVDEPAAATESQRAGLDVDAAGIVEQGAHFGVADALIVECTCIGEDRPSPSVGSTLIAGEDEVGDACTT